MGFKCLAIRIRIVEAKRINCANSKSKKRRRKEDEGQRWRRGKKGATMKMTTILMSINSNNKKEERRDKVSAFMQRNKRQNRMQNMIATMTMMMILHPMQKSGLLLTESGITDEIYGFCFYFYDERCACYNKLVLYFFIRLMTRL